LKIFFLFYAIIVAYYSKKEYVMKKITMSIISVLALSQMVFAGGDISKNVVVAEEEVVVIPEADDSGLYAGLAYSYISGSDKGTENYQTALVVWDEDFDANGIMLQLGYQFNKYIALEGRYTFSIGDITVSDNLNGDPDQDIDTDITNLAIYLKPMYPIGELTLYGLLGYGNTQIDEFVNGNAFDESGFQWGLGAAYAINDHFSVFADYTRWYDDDQLIQSDPDYTLSTEIDAISVGLTYKF